MASGRRTNVTMAATVKALSESGQSLTKISKDTGVPKSTCADIVNLRNGWDKLMSESHWTEYRNQTKRGLQAGFLELGRQALEIAEKKLHLSSASQAGVLAAISVDKFMALSGQAQQTVQHNVKLTDIKELDALAARLATSLTNHKSDDAIDVTPSTSKDDTNSGDPTEQTLTDSDRR